MNRRADLLKKINDIDKSLTKLLKKKNRKDPNK